MKEMSLISRLNTTNFAGKIDMCFWCKQYRGHCILSHLDFDLLFSGEETAQFARIWEISMHIESEVCWSWLSCYGSGRGWRCGRRDKSRLARCGCDLVSTSTSSLTSTISKQSHKKIRK